jgi:hypothetical protein
MTRVRLTFAARQRFPDIGTAHGTVVGTRANLGQWRRVEWTGERTTWLRDEDLEIVKNQETDISE